MVWSSKFKFKIWIWSNKWLLRYSTFNILRSSSIVVCLHFKDLWNMVCSSKLKFKNWVWSNKWLLRYSTLNIFRSSSIGGCLHLNHLLRWVAGPLWLYYYINNQKTKSGISQQPLIGSYSNFKLKLIWPNHILSIL